MGWSSEQQKRLGFEKVVLETYFKAKGKVRWIDPTVCGGTKVEVQMKTSNSRDFTLRVYLSKDFPNSCPEMVVCSPSTPLVKNDGRTLSGVSGTDHTLGTKDGMTKICHFRPEKWTSDNTLYQVFMKGLIWLEAYEGHRASGEPISNFLKEFSL